MEWVGLSLLVAWVVGVAFSVSRLLRQRRHMYGGMVPTMDLTDALATLERSGDAAVRGLPSPRAMTLRLEPRPVIAEASTVEDVGQVA